MLGAHLICVTLFSSNTYDVDNIFILCSTKKIYIYVTAVPDICCSKNPTTCTSSFLVCSTIGHISSPDTVSNFTLSQWDRRSSMIEYYDHVSTASSQSDCVSQSTLSHYNLANRCGRRSSSHSSPVSETRHV